MYLKDTIHIVSCTDKKYLQHLGVLITSLFENKTCTFSIVYHIIHTDLNTIEQELLIKSLSKYKVELTFHNVDSFNVYDSIIRYGHVSKAALYRLSIAELLPTIDKVLYLDCDIIINADIFDLWNVNIDSYQIAAVEDAPIFKRHEQLFIPSDGHYFNSGVLLINLKKWRENSTTKKIIDFLVQYPERRLYNDQDGLNAILHNDWLRLPPIYNQQTALFFIPLKRLVYSKTEFNQAKQKPVIIHYTGVLINSKPWDYIDSHPFKHQYYKYLKLTPWLNYQPSRNIFFDFFRKYLYILLRYKMKSGIVFSKILNFK
jgi:lipopolysaccharide biosynthesis glycosyltransferase